MNIFRLHLEVKVSKWLRRNLEKFITILNIYFLLGLFSVQLTGA